MIFQSTLKVGYFPQTFNRQNRLVAFASHGRIKLKEARYGAKHARAISIHIWPLQCSIMAAEFPLKTVIRASYVAAYRCTVPVPARGPGNVCFRKSEFPSACRVIN